MEKRVIQHFKERVEVYTRERELPSFPTDFKGRFLEVGCGARPSYSIDNIDFYGADITPDMIRAFKEVYLSVTLIICDVKFLPFKPNSFQLVLSNMLLHHLVGSNPSKCIYNIEKAIYEINRVLFPKSIFIIKEWLARNYLFTLIMYYVTLLCAKLNIEINSINIHSKVITYFLTDKKLLSLLEKNGFHIDKVIMKSWKLIRFNLGNNVTRAYEIISSKISQ